MGKWKETWILLSAPSGVRVEKVLNKLTGRIGEGTEKYPPGGIWEFTDKKADKVILFSSVQYFLENSSNTARELGHLDRAFNSFRKAPTVQQIFWYLPWKTASELLEEATEEAVRKITRYSRDEKDRVLVVITHFAFFSGQREEVRIKSSFPRIEDDFSISLFSRVITLIDDVYDIFLHLTREEAGVFSPSSSSELRPIEKLSILGHIMDWRQAEIMAAQDFASRTHHAEFLPFSIKQPIRTFLDVIENRDTIYLSHPITEVRKQNIREKRPFKEIGVVQEINSIPRRVADLSKNKLTVLVPTAIDELRFDKKERNVSGGGGTTYYSGTLSSRWPFIDDEENLLYSPPAEHKNYPEEEIQRIFNFTGENNEDFEAGYCSGLTEAMAQQINRQISSRDRLLVSGCNNILVYRPLYNRKDFSSGTSNELIQWMNKAKSSSRNSAAGRKGYAAIIHTLSDIKGPLANRGFKKLLGGSSFSEPFGGSLVAPADQRSQQEMQRKEMLLNILLQASLEDNLKNRVGIWVIEEPDELEEILPDVVKFFTEGKINRGRKQWWESFVSHKPG